MIEFPTGLIDWVDLPISGAPRDRRAVRHLVGTELPVCVGRSRLLGRVFDVIVYPEHIEVGVRLPVLVVPLPEPELA